MAGSVTQSPEKVLMRCQIAKLLEKAIARLPDTFRPVFVLREIEGLSSRTRPKPCKSQWTP